jgi:transcriptional regulator with XRE-family HTH domain
MAGTSESAKRIKILRESLGMTQMEFADQVAKAGQPKISDWEAGKNFPSAEVYLRLAKAAPYPENVWFLQQIGLDPEDVLTLADALEAESLFLPEEGEMVRVEPIEQPKGEGQEPVPSIPFSLALVKPVLTRYFRIDEHSAGYGFEVDDILVLDTSHVGMPSHTAFWDQIILVEHSDPADSNYREQFAGRLFLRESRHEGARTAAFYDGMLQPWTSLHHELGEMRGRSIKGYFRGDRLKDSGPFVITYGDQDVLKESETDIETGFASLRERAQAKIRLYPEFRILGRVTGWFRPPSKSGE